MVEEPKLASPPSGIKKDEIPSGEIPVYFVKSNFYRVVHVDGVYGGGSPTPGNIVMTVYNHRVPIPEKSINDAVGKEIIQKRDVRYGIENELEFSMVLELNTAKIIHGWLGQAIKNAEASIQPVHPQK